MTRLGDLLKFLVTNSLSKVAQILGDFLGYFEKDHFLLNTALDPFGARFRKNSATFLELSKFLTEPDQKRPTQKQFSVGLRSHSIFILFYSDVCIFMHFLFSFC